MNDTISVILPVWNEASIINHTIANILSQRCSEDMEIIVVDGSAEGETIHTVQDKEVRKVVSGKGRARQMNTGASLACGDILLFVHADTLLPGDALCAVSSIMQKREFVGGAFNLGIDSDRTVFRLIETAASLRSRITRVPYGDQGIFIRKDYFYAIGGFREIPLMEDVDLMRRIKKAGDTICILPLRVKTSPRRWEREGIIRCTLRNWVLIALYYLGFSPERLARYYP
ncbi:MAG TPA: TIGR04283 family arsenosugar biosynthesis glycosyltransferase [Thermodesulfovibrionales bacterium]|nr:TIGR04283 family arsenosugar biosynthesis glycosyltransferase [Thermodesulfovibrionales bacterium]